MRYSSCAFPFPYGSGNNLCRAHSRTPAATSTGIRNFNSHASSRFSRMIDGEVKSVIYVLPLLRWTTRWSIASASALPAASGRKLFVDCSSELFFIHSAVVILVPSFEQFGEPRHHFLTR